MIRYRSRSQHKNLEDRFLDGGEAEHQHMSIRGFSLVEDLIRAKREANPERIDGFDD
jgi:hypothetical protein